MNGEKGTSLDSQGDSLAIAEGTQNSKVLEVEKVRQEEARTTPKKDLSVFRSLEGEMEREVFLSP